MFVNVFFRIFSNKGLHFCKTYGSIRMKEYMFVKRRLSYGTGQDYA